LPKWVVPENTVRISRRQGVQNSWRQSYAPDFSCRIARPDFLGRYVPCHHASCAYYAPPPIAAFVSRHIPELHLASVCRGSGEVLAGHHGLAAVASPKTQKETLYTLPQTEFPPSEIQWKESVALQGLSTRRRENKILPKGHFPVFSMPIAHQFVLFAKMSPPRSLPAFMQERSEARSIQAVGGEFQFVMATRNCRGLPEGQGTALFHPAGRCGTRSKRIPRARAGPAGWAARSPPRLS